MNRNDYDLIADILRLRKDCAQFPAERIFLYETMRSFGEVFSGNDRHFDRHNWELRTEIGPDMARDHYRMPPPRRRMEHPPLMATAAPQAAANDPNWTPTAVNWLDEITQLPAPTQAGQQASPAQMDEYAQARRRMHETMLYGAPLDVLQQTQAQAGSAPTEVRIRPGHRFMRSDLPANPFAEHFLNADDFVEEHVEEGEGDAGGVVPLEFGPWIRLPCGSRLPLRLLLSVAGATF